MKINIAFVNIDSLYLCKRFPIFTQTFSIIYATVYIVFECFEHVVSGSYFKDKLNSTCILVKIKVMLQLR